MIIYKLKFIANNHMTLQIISFFIWVVLVSIYRSYFILLLLILSVILAILHYIWYKNFISELIIKKLKNK